jgi:hypothetical protein
MMRNPKFPIFYGFTVFIVLFAIGYGTGVGGSFSVNLIGSALLAIAAGTSFWMMRKYGGPKE